MGFRYIAKPTFEATVQITVVGEPDTVPLRVVFRYKTQSEREQFEQGMADRTVLDVIDDLVADLPDLEDEAGQPVAYSRERLETLLDNFPFAGIEIAQAYRRELMQARTKN